MLIRVITQLRVESMRAERVGDVLNKVVVDPAFQNFRSAAARMRMSGLDWDKETIDLSALSGGDLLVITKLPEENDPKFMM